MKPRPDPFAAFMRVVLAPGALTVLMWPRQRKPAPLDVRTRRPQAFARMILERIDPELCAIDHFATFMERVLEPGPIYYGSGPRTIDVRRLDGVQPQLLAGIDNVHNNWLSWLEAKPRTKDDTNAARRDWLLPP